MANWPPYQTLKLDKYMCGIAGIFTAREQDLSAIKAMTQVQAHRGPDGHGHVVFSREQGPIVIGEDQSVPTTPSHLAFGHRRLSIIDRTDGGHQPMRSATGQYWITYNGEIYNYKELRNELAALGHSFESSSDTEVALAAFAQWGVECFSRFNGMWAIAIWDTQSQTLTLSRDRLGVKPLHYYIDEDVLVFASEIKGLLASNHCQARVNLQAVYDWQAYGTVNHNNDTFFRDIHALAPGHYAQLRAGDLTSTLNSHPFWSMTTHASSMSYEQAKTQFRELFASAISLRMRSDVPVGSCLSGGLDSSSIVSEMSRQLNGGDLHTFTAGFPEKEFDERHWADIVIQASKATPHFSVPTQHDFLADLDSMIWHQDEPVASASLHAQWSVMREARQQGIPVLLDGQGADEALCGYKKFYALYTSDLLKRGRIGSVISHAVSLLRHGDRGYFRLEDLARYLPASLRPKGVKAQTFMHPKLRDLARTSTVSLAGTTDIRTRQIQDLTRYSLPSLLRYEDRNSMAWSVESRVPFLDYRFIEFAIALPTEFKLRGGRTKAILRDALRGLVPDAILDRRDKMGFVTPQVRWMNDALGERVMQECLNSAFLAEVGIDGPAMVAHWRQADEKARRTMQSLVFRTGMLAMWAKKFDVSAS